MIVANHERAGPCRVHRPAHTESDLTPGGWVKRRRIDTVPRFVLVSHSFGARLPR